MAEQRQTQPESAVAANYRYWQEHGGQWADEYAQRKQRSIYYHIQEIMLADYLAHYTPARVLEFGCGVGRHLRNLCQIPHLDVYGYDQSPTMVEGCRRWTGPAWMDEHIAVGSPRGPLPYERGAFDIVYTAEVLVHVRPEDLDTVLSELLRVCRGHVLHLETAEHYELVSGEHSGCWKHDLVAAYARLGRQCEILPAGYVAHAPYRVLLGQEPARYTWPPALLGQFRNMESDIERGFRELRGALEQQAGDIARSRQRETELQLAANALPVAKERCAALEREVADLRASLERQAETLHTYVKDAAQERLRQSNLIEQMQQDKDVFLAQANDALKG
jgi:SAM-dependent methyltransferase